MTATMVDLFAGAGGPSVAASLLGFDAIGVELDRCAAATHHAAGHATIRADVTTLDPGRFAGIEGLWASPPCTDWSTAGLGRGFAGATGSLVWEVERWAVGMRPRWIACEQTPLALPVWRVIAHRLRELGYSTWAGLLHAEQFGVAQTRTRAILLASLDGAVHPPEPTHQRYRSGEPARATRGDLLRPGLLPWVSVAATLGWSGPVVLNGGRTDAQPNRPLRSIIEPAPTLAFGHDAASWQWEDAYVDTHTNTDQRRGAPPSHYTRPVACPSPTLDGKAGGAWTFHRPATTVCGDPRLSPPGHHGEESGSQHGEGTVKLTVAEAACLQAFPAGFPWQGSRTAAFRQIGNAVPPPMAAACIGAVTGRDWREVVAGYLADLHPLTLALSPST